MEFLPQAPTIGAHAASLIGNFQRTHALACGGHWRRAANDVKHSAADMMRPSSSAAGVSLTPANAPVTATFVHQAAIDTSLQTNATKNLYLRRRPFLAILGRPANRIARSSTATTIPPVRAR